MVLFEPDPIDWENIYKLWIKLNCGRKAQIFIIGKVDVVQTPAHLRWFPIFAGPYRFSELRTRIQNFSYLLSVIGQHVKYRTPLSGFLAVKYHFFCKIYLGKISGFFLKIGHFFKKFSNYDYFFGISYCMAGLFFKRRFEFFSI